MLDSLLSILAPHYCCSCGQIGGVLCSYCKFNIVSEPYAACVVCGSPASGASSLCGACRTPYTKAWCVGERLSALKALINDYKFERVKSAGSVCAALLDETLPDLPPNTYVVAIPTVSSHRRVRGYDHSVVMARAFARRRQLPYRQVLKRIGNEGQRGAGKRQRIEQAKRAFTAPSLSGGTYLLIDDVMTTGATMHYGAETLLAAGADEVWVAVLAYQPLDKAA